MYVQIIMYRYFSIDTNDIFIALCDNIVLRLNDKYSKRTCVPNWKLGPRNVPDETTASLTHQPLKINFNLFYPSM